MEKEEIVALLSASDLEYKRLCKSNYPINKINDYYQSEATIEISNYCSAECNFCELYNGNNQLKRVRLNREEIIDKALKEYKMGKKTILLHSGYDKFYNTDRIAYIIYSIKKQADVKIMLSFGLRQFNEYREWKIAGADSYMLNFVTSNKLLYETTKSWGSFDERLAHIDELKRLGYNVGSGSIIGLPNQTNEDLVNDILLCRDLNLKYIYFCCSKFSSEKLVKRGVEVAQLAMPNTVVQYRKLIN